MGGPPMSELIGVGVGPGDPELITVKALRVLREADVVLVPVMAGPASSAGGATAGGATAGGRGPDAARPGSAETGRAEAVVRAHLGAGRIRRVPFALNDRGGVTRARRAAWEAAAREVAASFEAGARTVAFATIGDPSIYSTFSYLAQEVRKLCPQVTVSSVPGITAMQDLAARSGTVLAEGSESLVLIPLTAPDGAARVRAALASGDSIVAYKAGAGARSSGIADVLAAVEEAGRLGGAVYGARLGLPGEDIRPAGEVAAAAAVPYLSTLIVPGRRDRTGGKLR